MYFLQAPFYRAVSELLVLNLLRENNTAFMQIKLYYVPRVNHCFVCISGQTRYRQPTVFYIYLLLLIAANLQEQENSCEATRFIYLT